MEWKLFFLFGKGIRENWRAAIDAYLRGRESLRGIVLIMDSRHPLKDFDRQLLQFCHDIDLACHVLLTKADKLSRGEASAVLKQVRAAVEGVATVQLFSAVAKTGVDDARREVLQMLKAAGAKKSPVTP